MSDLIKLRCVDNSDMDEGIFAINLGAIYEGSIAYDGLDNFHYWKIITPKTPSGYAIYGKWRFVPADSVPQTALSQASAKPIIDDSKSELQFFAKSSHSNQCPCGGTIGVCPYHP